MSSEHKEPMSDKDKQLLSRNSLQVEEAGNPARSPSRSSDSMMSSSSDVSFYGDKDKRKDSSLSKFSAQIEDEEPNNGSSPQNRKKGSSLTRFVRGLVSKKKKRMQGDEFDLDLTYITPRIIAMGFPVDDDSFSSNFRNPFSEVYAFLEKFHKEKYKVYNLCSEKKYDSAKFHGRVSRFPFDDHNCPSFDMILAFCQDVEQWMSKDPDHTIAVHCKAGKGRTGLMISCYLVYSNQSETAQKALEHFGKERTHNGKGVTIPSQIRYVGYFEKFLNEFHRPNKPFPMHGVAIRLISVTMSSVPHFDADGGCDPYVLISDPDGETMYDSRTIAAPVHVLPSKKISAVELPTKSTPVLRGDVKFLVIDFDKLTNDDLMFSFWMNTAFLPKEGVFELSKPEIDRCHKDKKNKTFDKNFKIKIHYVIADDKEDPFDKKNQIPAWKKIHLADMGTVVEENNDAPPPPPPEEEKA